MKCWKLIFLSYNPLNKILIGRPCDAVEEKGTSNMRKPEEQRSLQKSQKIKSTAK